MNFSEPARIQRTHQDLRDTHGDALEPGMTDHGGYNQAGIERVTGFSCAGRPSPACPGFSRLASILTRHLSLYPASYIRS